MRARLPLSSSYETAVPAATAHKAIRSFVRAGIVISIGLVGILGGWAFATEISGAVMAPGAIVVDSNVKKVQHPTGGVVGEILARDGQSVKSGDVLLRLDETITRANLAIIAKSLHEFRARQARLDAERDDGKDIRFPAELVQLAASDSDIAQLIASERRLFESRLTARTGTKSVLVERSQQLEEQIKGTQEQVTSKSKEIELIQNELDGARELWRKNLIPISKITALEREAARLSGERAQLVSQIAQTKGRISEVALQILQIDRETSSEAGKELREVEAKIGELMERKITAEDQMRRIDIRAPQDGVVHQSVVHTVGGVINAGELLMLIVPASDKLTAEVKIAPQDIDQLWVGQPTLLRFTAFNQRTTPEIHGQVERISADISTDQKTGQSFYTVRIALTSDEIAKLGTVKIVPGMPVETMIKTADRKVISYLVKPLQDQVTRAFREK